MAGAQWIINLQSELAGINPETELERQRKQCIYKVPKVLRDLNGNAYTPQLVSFGPYHHGASHLKPMERYKRLALSNYLRRAEKTVAEVADAMRPEVRELMEAYDGLEEPWTDDEKFLELMIVDSCFFLDLMIWKTVEFWRPYMTVRLWMDMLRLENQLPLAALAVLIEVGGKKTEDTRKFIKYYPNTPQQQRESISWMGFHHLDIYRKDVTIKGSYSYNPYWSIRQATELYQAGVRFERSESDSLKDISFGNGVLKLPFLKVDDNTEPLLLNYLAYEQILNIDNVVTSYAFLMDNLIDTDKDVVLLREMGIIRGWIGIDHDIAALFNRLTKAMSFANGKGKVNVNESLNRYCNKRWHRWRASFMQTYASNPWVFISLIGASILLLLTVTQTTYTILPYYKKS